MANKVWDRIITLPLAKLSSILIASVVFYALARAMLIGESFPLPWPLVTAILSIVVLYFRRAKRDRLGLFLRVGFHIGMFTYFLSFPILSPGSVDPTITPGVHELLGLTLLLTVIGFEAGYWLKISFGNSHRAIAREFVITASLHRRLLACVYIGFAAWLFTVLDYAWSAGVSAIDVFLMMRGTVIGAPAVVVTNLGYLSFILGGGIFLGAACAMILLIASRRMTPPALAVCWLALVCCVAVGFMAGSRAVFLYSFTPLVITCWIKLSRLPGGKSTRWIWIGASAALLVVIWGAMSAMRGDDIRRYEGGLNAMSPAFYAQGAFDIYSATAKIVEAFPERIPFENGRSLVPLALGWVPRPMWPNKPYPFSLYANILKGETLQKRSASIAVGLPGEGYGNFGLFGAFLWGALMGFACRWGDDRIARIHRANPLRLQLAATGAIWAAMIVRGGVPEMFYMGLNVMMFPVAIAWFLSRSKRSAHAYRRSVPPVQVHVPTTNNLAARRQ